MASSYPGGLDGFATSRTDATASASNHAGDHNNLADAVNKIEAELGIHPSSSGSTLAARLASTLPIDVKIDFGAVGDNVADDTTALQNAINAALAQKRPLYIPPSDYKITAPLDMRGDGLQVIGASPWFTTIHQTTGNTVGIRLGGQHQKIMGFGLNYPVRAVGTDVNSVAFEFYGGFVSEYQELCAWNCGKGFALWQGGLNGTFSCRFSTLEVSGYSISAIDFTSTSTYSTGNVWSNIYTHNNPAGTSLANTGPCVLFGYCDEQVIHQLNIEWSNPADDALSFVQCKNNTIDGLHFEQISPTVAAKGFVRLFDQCKLQLRAMSLSFNTVAASLGSFKAFSIGGGNVFLDVSGLNLNTNTVSTTGTTMTLVGYDATPTNGSVSIIEAETSIFAAMTLNDAIGVPNVKRINEEYTDPSITRTGSAGRIFLPTTAKLENMPRWGQAFASQAALASGTIRVFPLGVLRGNETVSAIRLICSVAGSGAPTNSWAGLVRLPDRTVIARSATSTTNPTANTIVTFTFSAPYTPVTDEVVAGFVMYQVTTPPAFYGINQVNTVFLSVPVINGTANTGATTPIALGTVMSAFTVDTEVFYGQLT